MARYVGFWARIMSRRSGEWQREVNDVLRGAAGGFLFGTPLIYTMEVWWIGSYTNPPKMLGAMLATFVVTYFLNRTDGFRKFSSERRGETFRDSVECLALGILGTGLILTLLREITLQTPLDEALGKIIFESVPFALGVALAQTLVSGDRNGSPHEAFSPSSRAMGINIKAFLSDVGATLVGATFIAFNIAPTDEVSLLAAATSPPWLLGIVGISLAISYIIVFVAGFTAQDKRHQQEGIFQSPWVETVLCYLVSLLAAGAMLFFFHQLSFHHPWQLWLYEVLILGLPATIGGAAGRLAI